MSSGMSCGSTARPPRRATVSAIRRPATAVMLATTIGRRGADPVGRRQVDVEPGADVGAARHHEDVVVGELVGRGESARKRMGVVALAAGPGPDNATAAGRQRTGRRPRATVRRSERSERNGPSGRERAAVPAGAARPRLGLVVRATWGARWEALLEDAGRTVIGVDLLGHGGAQAARRGGVRGPHGPARRGPARRRIGRCGRVLARRGHAARAGLPQPERFGRIVVAGVGDNVFRGTRRGRRLIAGVGATATTATCAPGVPPVRPPARQRSAGAGRGAGRRPAPSGAELAAVTCPVLVCSATTTSPAPPTAGGRAARREARRARNADHFATPESFAFIDAALGFLEAVPA